MRGIMAQVMVLCVSGERLALAPARENPNKVPRWPIKKHPNETAESGLASLALFGWLIFFARRLTGSSPIKSTIYFQDFWSITGTLKTGGKPQTRIKISH